jgi:prevent-host-death family protein
MTIKRTETIAATEFKARCLELMDRVQASGLSVTITKHGKPVAQLVPTPAKAAAFFASLPVTIVGDIVEPTGDSWDAEK